MLVRIQTRASVNFTIDLMVENRLVVPRILLLLGSFTRSNMCHIEFCKWIFHSSYILVMDELSLSSKYVAAIIIQSSAHSTGVHQTHHVLT
jgi:hypothetical protein